MKSQTSSKPTSSIANLVNKKPRQNVFSMQLNYHKTIHPSTLLQEEDLSSNGGNQASQADSHRGGAAGDGRERLARDGVVSVVATGGNSDARRAVRARAVVVVVGRLGDSRAVRTRAVVAVVAIVTVVTVVAVVVVASGLRDSRAVRSARAVVVVSRLGHGRADRGLHASVGGHDDDSAGRLLVARVSLDLGNRAHGGVHGNDFGGDVAGRAVGDRGGARGDGVSARGVDDAGGHLDATGGAVAPRLGSNRGSGSLGSSRHGGGGLGGGRHGGGGGGGFLVAAVVENLTDPLVVSLTVHLVLEAEVQVPERNTTKAGALSVLADNVLERLVTDMGGVLGVGGKTNVELGVLAVLTSGNGLLPLIVVEVLLVGSVAGNQVAAGVVVELDEEGVKVCLLNHLAHVKVLLRQGALRSARDENARVESTESLDHGNPGAVV